MIPTLLTTPLGALISPTLLWAGLGLATIPIIIHLLNRRKVRRVPWAAMHWLAAALKRHQRRLRVENWLLLLMRMAALALLGLALARPILEDSRLAGALGGKRSVYLVLDNSYSTEAKVNARAAFDLVQQQANAILDTLGADDALSVLVTNDPFADNASGLLPYVLRTRTVGGEGAARAKEALAGVRPRHAPARWPDVFAKLEEQMAPEDVGRQVYIVTDFQARDWVLGEGEGASDNRLRESLERVLRAPSAVRIVDVGGRDRRNLAVTEISNQTEHDPFVGRAVQLAVTVANHAGTPIRGAALSVNVGDSGYSRSIPIEEIPGGQTDLRVPTPGTTTVRVDLPPHAFANPGVQVVSCTVTPPEAEPGSDALARDSTRWFALEVRPQMNVAAWTQTSRQELENAADTYLRGVYEGALPDERDATSGGMPGFYRYESMSFESDLQRRLMHRADNPLDLVVLANAAPSDSRTVAALSAFVHDGGALLVLVGDRIGDADSLNALFYKEDGESLLPRPFAPLELRSRAKEGEAPFALDLRTRENAHPVARPFTDEIAQGWVARFPPQIWGRMPFVARTPVAPEDGEGEPPADDDDAQPPEPEPDPAVLLTFRDGKAAMVAGEYGAGRTLWVGTSIDNGWMAGAAWFFLPLLLEEAAMWTTEPRSGDRNLVIGDTVRVRAPVGAQSVRFSVGGNARSPTAVGDASEGAINVDYRYDDVGTAGPWRFSYERSRADGETEVVARMLAVNVDPNEGALAPAKSKDVIGGLPEGLDLTIAQTFESDGADLDDATQGELTRWILWAVLALLALESLLALRFGRRRAVADVDEVTT